MSETVRLLLSAAAAEDIEIASLGVKSAFLYNLIPLIGFIYMRDPGNADMPAAIRVQKCTYRLPHAAATFRKHNDASRRSFGFTSIVSDPSLFCTCFEMGRRST